MENLSKQILTKGSRRVYKKEVQNYVRESNLKGRK